MKVAGWHVFFLFSKFWFELWSFNSLYSNWILWFKKTMSFSWWFKKDSLVNKTWSMFLKNVSFIQVCSSLLRPSLLDYQRINLTETASLLAQRNSMQWHMSSSQNTPPNGKNSTPRRGSLGDRLLGLVSPENVSQTRKVREQSDYSTEEKNITRTGQSNSDSNYKW